MSIAEFGPKEERKRQSGKSNWRAAYSLAARGIRRIQTPLGVYFQITSPPDYMSEENRNSRGYVNRFDTLKEAIETREKYILSRTNYTHPAYLLRQPQAPQAAPAELTPPLTPPPTVQILAADGVGAPLSALVTDRIDRWCAAHTRNGAFPVVVLKKEDALNYKHGYSVESRLFLANVQGREKRTLYYYYFQPDGAFRLVVNFKGHQKVNIVHPSYKISELLDGFAKFIKKDPRDLSIDGVTDLTQSVATLRQPVEIRENLFTPDPHVFDVDEPAPAAEGGNAAGALPEAAVWDDAAIDALFAALKT